jgi:hypothetical protein
VDVCLSYEELAERFNVVKKGLPGAVMAIAP